MSRPIQRSANGVTVTAWTDGWPRSYTIDGLGARGDQSVCVSTKEQAEGLSWALKQTLKADKEAE